MVKMHYNKLLLLGLNPKELEHLKQGQPLDVRLDDLGLVGQSVVIVTGKSDEQLKRQAESAADRLENSKRLIVPN